MADEDILTNMTAATNDENLEIQDTFTSVGSSMSLEKNLTKVET